MDDGMAPDGAAAPDDGVLWRRGDRESFGVLFERHVEAVWNHAYRLTASWEQAHDVTSATFLTAWRTRAEVTAVRDSALPLLYAKAGDVVRTAHQALDRATPLRVVDDGVETAVRVDGESWLREVVEGVRRLPHEQREVAELCLLGDLPVADAAAHLGVAESVVRSRLALARTGLAEDTPDDETRGYTAARALPAELRTRLRAEFDHGLDHRPRRSFRLPAVVLAAVVLLAGTVFVLRQTPDAPPAAAVAGPPLNEKAAAAALDRCWSAVRGRGMADRFPDRSRWQPVLTVGDSQIGVVAARADGKPLFCQTTATTATVTDPSAAPGTGTAAVLFSSEGVVAGVTDVDWRLIALKGTGPSGSVAVRAETGGHMFVARTGVNLAGAALTISETGSEDPTAVRTLTAPAPPAVVVSDRPDGPAPDRTSEAGRALGDCLARSPHPLPDPDSYQTGALVTYPGGLVVLGRNSGSTVTCQSDGETIEAVRALLGNSGAPAVLKGVRFVEDFGIVISGELAPEVATIGIG
ncbi:MAG: sigma-70 family RNA polymerase sigma factor, partial [Umezawaea sp.]